MPRLPHPARRQVSQALGCLISCLQSPTQRPAGPLAPWLLSAQSKHRQALWRLSASSHPSQCVGFLFLSSHHTQRQIPAHVSQLRSTSSSCNTFRNKIKMSRDASYKCILFYAFIAHAHSPASSPSLWRLCILLDTPFFREQQVSAPSERPASTAPSGA